MIRTATRSPTRQPATPSPTAVTVPAASQPRALGKRAASAEMIIPARVEEVDRVTAAAPTRTWSSPVPGAATARSSERNRSGSPNESMTSVRVARAVPTVDQAGFWRATRVFWEQGYEGASLTDLTDAMGISRTSMYAAFGNKEELFRRVLKRYTRGPAAYGAQVLCEPTARQVAAAFLRALSMPPLTRAPPRDTSASRAPLPLGVAARGARRTYRLAQ